MSDFYSGIEAIMVQSYWFSGLKWMGFFLQDLTIAPFRKGLTTFIPAIYVELVV